MSTLPRFSTKPWRVEKPGEITVLCMITQSRIIFIAQPFWKNCGLTTNATRQRILMTNCEGNIRYKHRRRQFSPILQQYKRNTIKNTIPAINHQQAIWIKFHDHSWLFHQSLKKLAFVERLFWQFGTHFCGRCRCRKVSTRSSQCMDCPPALKKRALIK